MIVTEIKKVKIDSFCADSPVYLSWINTLGGREYWLFRRVQTHNLDTKEGATFEPYINELETARGQVFDIDKKAEPKLIVGANVLIEDLNGIKTCLYSLRVEMLINPLSWETEGAIWRLVRPNAGSFRLYDTTDIRTEIEFSLDLPYINNQEL